MKSCLGVIVWVLMSYFANAQQNQLLVLKVNSLLAKMTIAEKIGQLNQLDGRGIHGTIDELKVLVAKGRLGSLMNITDPKIINELQAVACEKSRIGIPLIFTRDVVHGFKTMLPIPLGQAASFNPQLVKLGAHMAAVEATEHGIKWSFAPMIDIVRDARWGRIAESFGEDTYLTSEMAKAVVNGFQGQDLANPQSMAACLKHFVGYGAAEGGRDYNSTFIPERQLREVYLPPFKKAIDMGAASLMTSFNENDGIPVSSNKYLLKEILRKEWSFDGVVVSDWGSVTELVRHGVVDNNKEAAEKAINAGVDVEMSSKSFIENLEKLVIEGKVLESTIDEAVENVLLLKFKLGLFDNPFVDLNKNPKTYSKKHLEIAKRSAEESIVLLKNDKNTLPFLGNIKSILITGPLADAPHDQLGTWTMDGEVDKTQTPAKAIIAKYGKKVKVHFVPTLTYSRDKNQSEFDKAMEIASTVDAIVVFAGEEAILTGEAHSLANLNLQGAQSELIARLKTTGKPLVTVVMAGRPLTISKEATLSDALLYAWHPGTMGGPALADILFGKTNPGGKLPVTFPKHVGQIPIYYNHPRTGRPATGKEKSIDEIPLNAKQSVLGHSSYYLDVGSKPLFPFGYGLSYTSFKYDSLKIVESVLGISDTLHVSVELKNTGQYNGTDVVQLYTTDLLASVTRPVKELKSFKKIYLEIGAFKTIDFKIPISDLAFWNIDMQNKVEPGKFKLMIGNNSDEGLETFFEVK
jgi:beta-glucosidase